MNCVAYAIDENIRVWKLNMEIRIWSAEQSDFQK